MIGESARLLPVHVVVLVLEYVQGGPRRSLREVRVGMVAIREERTEEVR